MPRPLIYISLIILALALLPPAIIATMRTSKSSQPRIHFIQDMDNQGKFRAQHKNPMFEDGRAMRLPVAGTVAHDELLNDTHFNHGRINDQWAEDFPSQIAVTEELMQRGRERFDIYCLPCHGMSGYGDGAVDQRARDLLLSSRLGKGTVWTQPRSLHEETVRLLAIGEIFNTISNGKNNMPAYGAQIPVHDRWAIAAWVRVLQRSQNAAVTDIARDVIEELETINLIETNEKQGVDGEMDES